MIKVKSLGKNKTELETEDYVILVSYETPVSYYDKMEGKYYRTSEFWSVTTSRHINEWLEGINANEVSQDTLDKLLE